MENFNLKNSEKQGFFNFSETRFSGGRIEMVYSKAPRKKNTGKNSPAAYKIKDGKVIRISTGEVVKNPDLSSAIIKRKKEIKKSSIHRAGSKIRKLILENNLKYCWTLTYKDNQTDRKIALKDFKLFIEKVNRWIKSDKTFNYVAVMEQQKRGAWHFHIAVQAFMGFEKIEKLWKKGFVQVNENTGDLGKIAGYLAKYLKKSLEDGIDDLSGERKVNYLCSRGLKQPEKVSGVMTETEFELLKDRASVVKEFETGYWMLFDEEEAGKIVEKKLILKPEFQESDIPVFDEPDLSEFTDISGDLDTLIHSCSNEP